MGCEIINMFRAIGCCCDRGGLSITRIKRGEVAVEFCFSVPSFPRNVFVENSNVFETCYCGDL